MEALIAVFVGFTVFHLFFTSIFFIVWCARDEEPFFRALLGSIFWEWHLYKFLKD